MIVNGIDTDSVPAQFESVRTGRTLILDGDGPCYVAAATGGKKLSTILGKFQQIVLSQKFMTGSQFCRVHISSPRSYKNGRFRVNAVKKYQGNRVGKSKPPMLEVLREAVLDESTWLDEYSVLYHTDIEADDGMMQDAYILGESGVICSEDKDLRMTPYTYYEIKRGQVLPSQPVGYVSIAHTNAGIAKLTGQGPMFFWGQMLCGDTADNIQGLLRYEDKLCGPVTAANILEGVGTIDEAANLVIDAYRAIDQNVIAEGWMLWLTRSHTDNVIDYIKSLELSELNTAFVDECLSTEWFSTEEEDYGEDG